MTEIRPAPPRSRITPPLPPVVNDAAATPKPPPGASRNLVQGRDARARSAIERKPGMSTAGANAVWLLLEPKTPQLEFFDDVDRPNSNVRKDEVGRVDAAFKERMQARGLSFKDGRMHPLLHDMCQEILAQLGPGIRHPRLREKFGLLLAARLAEALKDLKSSIHLKDRTPSQTKGIESVLNVRAHTYVAALLGLSTQKTATDLSEYEILKKNLDSGNSKIQLTKAFDSYGAQGFLVLLNLEQRLRTMPRRGMDTEFLAPRTVTLHLRSASTLLRTAQQLFAPEPGKLADWIGDPEREERVLAAATANVQPYQTNADNNGPQTHPKYSRKRFDNCLPYLRESVAAGFEITVIPSTGSSHDPVKPAPTTTPAPCVKSSRSASSAPSQDSLLDPEVLTFLSTIAADTSQSQLDDFDADELLSFFDEPVSGHKRKADQAFSDSP
jgi:hypothetical protein